MEHRIMAKTKSSTKTSALRGGTQTGGVFVPFVKTEAHAALFSKHDACHLIADELHSLVLCMSVLADTHLNNFAPDEKKEALAFVEWQIVLKSRELQAAFK
jgi:hypothetical protein